MVSPTGGLNLDLEALSGICGYVKISHPNSPFSQDDTDSVTSSISIACWIVVFTPQILENFRRHSASGLSLLFIIVWLLGDIFNILGAVLQGVLPTMTILAVYYTFADIVLLGQCFYYRGWRLSDLLKEDSGAPGADQEAGEEEDDEEDTPLLQRRDPPTPPRHLTPADTDRRRLSNSSLSSFHEHLRNIDPARLSPATPLRPPKKASDIPPSHSEIHKQSSPLMALLYNTSALLLVCAAGVLGWWLSERSTQPHYPHSHPHPHHTPSPPQPSALHTSKTKTSIHMDPLGQVFGYLCAALYLASRIPQLLLNHRRKSTEGVSVLFFLFACVGNLTYVLSICAYEPTCARIAHVALSEVGGGGGGGGGGGVGGGWVGDGAGGCEKGEWTAEYARYILVNTSWLIGSGGTLVLDLLIFGQFWMYRGAGLRGWILDGWSKYIRDRSGR
ncbi:PQ loop repeat protein [Physcia stellaris]|nr:PQ loop repeat protein [Physcia stellaris]